MLSDDQIKQFAGQLNFPPYPIIREYLQTVFVLTLYQLPQLATTYFKGGTCLRLVFHSGRFSEDLDFTTNLDASDVESLLTETTNKLTPEFENLTLKQKKSLAGLSYSLSYKAPQISMPISIRLDFSFRENVLDPEVSTITTIYPVSFFSPIPHISLKEMVAEKVRALMHRTKGRDLYDLHYLLSRQAPFDINFINKKLSFYHEVFNPSEFRERIKTFPQEDLQSDLVHFIPKNQRGIIPHLSSQILELL